MNTMKEKITDMFRYHLTEEEEKNMNQLFKKERKLGNIIVHEGENRWDALLTIQNHMESSHCKKKETNLWVYGRYAKEFNIPEKLIHLMKKAPLI